MKTCTTKVALLLAVIALAVSCTNDPAEMGNGAEDATVNSKILFNAADAIKGELLIKFSPAVVKDLEQNVTRSGLTRSGISKFDAIMSQIGATSIERLFPVDTRHEARTMSSGLGRWYVVKFSDEQSLEAAAVKFASVEDVDYVEYNLRVVPLGWGETILYDGASEAGANTRAASQFNDPYLNKQWHYINTGDVNLTQPIKAGCDVNCAEAWELCTGDPSIVVAVVDAGVMYSHEDLADNMWVNEIEKNGLPNTDNDGNGYKNDVYGYNFVGSGSSTITFGDHGTHVAGTVAAVNNNGKGVCGVAGGSGNHDGVRIMSCQIFTPDGSSTSASQTSKAIKYAADNGANIIQCSWGVKAGGYADDNAWGTVNSYEKDAIDYFIANAGSDDPSSPMSGGIAIFAAGNDGMKYVGYPGAYARVVGVTALASDFTPATYTNYGTAADIAAPGGDYGGYYNNNDAGMILSTVPNGTRSSYGYSIGTSMATPHVSGVAALGLSYAKKLGKHYTADEFRSLLLSSVNSIDQYMVGIKNYTPYKLTNGLEFKGTMDLGNDYNKKMGIGYTDAYRLLLAVKGVPGICVSPNQSKTIDLTSYFGGVSNYAFQVTVSDSEREKVGLDYAIQGDKMTFTCGKRGTAIVSIIVNNGGYKITRDVAIISREGYTGGGWL